MLNAEYKDRLSDLRDRTKKYAIRIVRLYSELPKTTLAQTLGKQVLRSGTSVGANFHESCRAKSNADLINKIQTCLQELDETNFWLELIVEAGLFSQDKLGPLMKETDELLAIFVASVKKIRQIKEK